MLAEAPQPSLPPMMRAERASAPFAQAVRAARAGTGPGLVVWNGGARLEAGIVLAPEVPLGRAVQMLPAASVALRDALGATGPSEMPVHLEWPSTVRIGGGVAGRLRMAAATADPAAIPDWLVIGLTLAFAAPAEGGRRPDETALHAEGAGDLTPQGLLESWSRHLLHRIADWEEPGGDRRLHDQWTGVAWPDEAWVGLDEGFGALRRVAGEVRLTPLTEALE